MNLIFLLFFSLGAFADDVQVGDLVRIAPEMPRHFYSGAWLVNSYESLQNAFNNIRTRHELEDEQDRIYNQLKAKTTPAQDREKVYRVGKIVTDDHGAIQAVLRNANLWLVDRSGHMGETKSARIRSLNYQEFLAHPERTLAGESNPESFELSVIATKFLRRATHTLNIWNSGDIVIYDSPKVHGRLAVGIVRMLFSDRRALIYPLSAFGELRRQLGSVANEGTYIEPTFSPDLVGFEELGSYLGPRSSVIWQPLHNHFKVERKYHERVQDRVARWFCDEVLNPSPRTTGTEP